MPRFSTDDTALLERRIASYLDNFPNDVICPLQIWYEELGGYGVPEPADTTAVTNVLDRLEGWTDAGVVRYEKFGEQRSYKRTKGISADELPQRPDKRLMVQHLFKVGGLYKTPDGRVYKVALSEVYNLRCFEIVDGHMAGGMVKIHPASELAKSLVPVAG
ncbi:MAG: hypothetical protein LBB57_04170 [Clostridiales Family XIII bacterium]|jgi:hypothetical protein|nr:hypothetical protein [Clostridiales Family XIII bacterium]